MLVDYSLHVNVISYDVLLNMCYTNDDIKVAHETYKAFDSHETIILMISQNPYNYVLCYLNNLRFSLLQAYGFYHAIGVLVVTSHAYHSYYTLLLCRVPI